MKTIIELAVFSKDPCSAQSLKLGIDGYMPISCGSFVHAGGRKFEVQAVVFSPLDQELRVWLSPFHDSFSVTTQLKDRLKREGWF